MIENNEVKITTREGMDVLRIVNKLGLKDDIYNAILLWGDKHLNKSYKCLKHKSCGSNIHIAYVCDECDEILSKEDIIITDLDDVIDEI